MSAPGQGSTSDNGSAATTGPRDLAWFLARTHRPTNRPPRTAGEWNRQSVAAFIANRSPKEATVPDQTESGTSGPDDVPDEWVRLALIAWFNDGRTRLTDFGHGGDDCEHMADAIAAVAPAIRQAERAKVAAEIEDPTVWPDPLGAWTADQADAARAMKAHILRRITRGETP